jgi:pimeloyl-ACP methyl ester carboxylesterase
MERAKVHGVELEYERYGVGDPVLLIHGAFIPDGMRPFCGQDVLASFELISYHRRGFADSARPPGPTTIADHAADAIGLLDHLGVARAHVVGHSSGAAIALEIAATDPSRVASLSLLEPPYLSGVAGAEFSEVMAPILERHSSGDTAGAVADFYGLIGDPDWRATIERSVPGGVAQAEKNAATSLEIELPAVAAWSFGPGRGAAVSCPVLSVLGTATGPLFVDSRQLVHQWLPQCVDADIPGATHLLQMEAPAAVAAAVGRFLTRGTLGPCAVDSGYDGSQDKARRPELADGA